VAGESRPEATESCLRCGAAMDWRHGTWQCPRCRFKIGCCEGATGESEYRNLSGSSSRMSYLEGANEVG